MRYVAPLAVLLALLAGRPAPAGVLDDLKAKAVEEAEKRAAEAAVKKARELAERKKSERAPKGDEPAGGKLATSDPVRDKGDPAMGEYAGTYQPQQGDIVGGAGAAVGLGDAKHRHYRVVLTALEPGRQVKTLLSVELSGAAGEDGKVSLAGAGASADWKGQIAGDSLTAEGKAGRFALRFRVRRSPTEGAVPPAGAVVLLGFQPGRKTSLEEWTNDRWERLGDGSVRVRGGSNLTKRQFGDCRLHVEFLCPYEPEKAGQGRANSGVYLHGKYEVQVLDSFGLKSGQGDCAAIYGVRAPSANACLPPGRWQTYDIVFRAPRTGADGKLAEPASFVSVRHNDLLVQENVPVDRITTAGQGSGHSPTGPLMLQDHGNPVRYRNVWLVETK